METKTTKIQKKDTIMARTTKTPAQMIAAEVEILVTCGLSEDMATTVATAKVNKLLAEAEKKAEEDKKKADLDVAQEIEDAKELARIAAIVGKDVPENVSRFSISTVAVKEEQEVDGKKQMIEIGRRISKVRLYFTVGESKRASEINSQIKTFETEELLNAEVEAAKIDLFNALVK